MVDNIKWRKDAVLTAETVLTYGYQPLLPAFAPLPHPFREGISSHTVPSLVSWTHFSLAGGFRVM